MQEEMEGRGALLPSLGEVVRAPEAYIELIQRRLRSALNDRESRQGAILLLSAAIAVLVLFVAWTGLLLLIPNAGHLSEATVPEATIAYTADGYELTRYHIENRTWVPLENISEPVIEALLATEDHRFFRHNGIDLWRVAGAILGTAEGNKQGGSTITMQLARNVFPEIRDDYILLRKVKEWLIALRIEDRFSKKEILEMYLNMVPFMYDAVGIEAAARTYFEKPASDLDLLEAATLVGMLKATVYYNPVRQPERSQNRRNTVLFQMVRHGYLDRSEFDTLQMQPTQLHFRRLTRHQNRAPFFSEYVRQWLDQWAEANGYNLYTEGLRVYTTLDSQLQQDAEASVGKVLEDLQAVVDVEWSNSTPFVSTDTDAYKRMQDGVEPFAYFWEKHPEVRNDLLRTTTTYRNLLQEFDDKERALETLRSDSAFVDSLQLAYQQLEAGFVAIEPATGHVKAWVGGRSFENAEYDHVALARRQPGSTFKPFVYTAALENGYAPYSLVMDAVRDYVDPYTGQRWRPKNFGGASGRLVSLRQGLAYSKNTVTAQLITSIGPSEVARVARLMGIRSNLNEVPSLGLGTSEVTLLEMAGAYGVFANLGVYREPVFVERIEDRFGRTIATFTPEPKQAIPPHTAEAVLDMMRGVINYGTGVRLRSMFNARGDFAGKTGTTQNGADGWFMLMHPDLVMGSWVGFDSPLVTFRSGYWGQGAHNALHVTGEFYRRAAGHKSGYLNENVSFPEGPEHTWRSTRVVRIDDLNRQERNRNRLDKVLEQLKEQKENS